MSFKLPFFKMAEGGGKRRKPLEGVFKPLEQAIEGYYVYAGTGGGREFPIQKYSREESYLGKGTFGKVYALILNSPRGVPEDERDLVVKILKKLE